MSYSQSLDTHKISAGNSTTALLTNGATFTGVWEDVTKYATVGAAILGSIQTDGTLYFDVSTDGGSTFTTIPSAISDATFAVPRILNVVETHVRIRYLNGSTPQTGAFSIQTKYSNSQQLGVLNSVDGVIKDETPTQVTRSVTTSKQPNGTYKNNPHNGVAIKTEAVLLGSATFTSDWIDTDGYNVIETHIEADVTSAKNGVIFEFTDDLSGTPIARFQEVYDYGTSEVDAGFENIFIQPQMVGFRIKYTNNGVTQSSFLLQTDLKTNGIINDVSLPPTVLFTAKRPTDPVIPSGVAITIDPVLNTEPNVVDSGWISVKQFGGGSLINAIGDTSLQIYLLNSSDSAGNNSQGSDTPALVSNAGFSSTIGSAFFDDFFRIVVVNVSGTTSNSFSVKAQALQTPAASVFLSVDQEVFGFFPAPLSRGIGVAINPNGSYINAPAPGVADAMGTSIPLGIGGNFTTPWCNVASFGEAKFAMSTDVESASCFIQLSHDGVSVHTSLSLPPQFVASQSKWGFIHSLNPSLPYLRINYTNGAVAQTEFDFTTTLLVSSGVGFVSRATQILDRFTDVKNSRVVNSPEQDRNFGLINYQTAERVLGVNESVGNGAFEIIWSKSVAYVFPQVAETLRIAAGGDAGDDSAGLGARTIKLTFLDSNWDVVTETLTTAGASASVATSVTAYRLLQAEVITVGAYHGSNLGDINIEQSTSGDVLGFISIGIGITEQAIYTVPANKTMYITEIFVSVGQNNSADVHLRSVRDVDNFSAPFGTSIDDWSLEDYSGADNFPKKTFLKFDEKTDIFFEGERQTGSGDARISVDFDFILTDNI